MKNYLTYIITYLIIISVITFITYSIDKKRAKSNPKHRIKESTLLLLSLLGGAYGGYVAMITKHHKTKHWYFVITNILSIVLYTTLIYFIVKS